MEKKSEKVYLFYHDSVWCIRISIIMYWNNSDLDNVISYSIFLIPVILVEYYKNLLHIHLSKACGILNSCTMMQFVKKRNLSFGNLKGFLYFMVVVKLLFMTCSNLVFSWYRTIKHDLNAHWNSLWSLYDTLHGHPHISWPRL